jgi:dipeptidyl aminopeptidase/acylaminoacyl peptidase
MWMVFLCSLVDFLWIGSTGLLYWNSPYNGCHMCNNQYTGILKTPHILRGFDIRGGTIVISRANKENELHIITNGELKRLCRGFSPFFVGEDILYMDAVDGDRTDIFLYQPGHPVNLTKKGRNLAPQPSPDGKSIAFLSGQDGPLSLYLLNLTEKKSRHLITPESHLSLRPCAWSPDGKHILYWAREALHNSGIWRFSFEPGETERLIYFPESSTRVGSPYIWYLSDSLPSLKSTVWVDQERFVFLSDVKGYDSFGISTLKGEIQWIDDRSTSDKEFYTVSPDAAWIAYNEYVDGTTRLVFFSLEEGTRKEVTNGCLSCPQWGEKGVYCWGSSPVKGTGIIFIPLEGEPEHLYWEPPPFPTFEPVPIHYQTFDGREIGAWLYNPEAPHVVVWLHGGPADICLNNFDPVIQYMALNGVAVFTPNFRGSTGYGKEFERLNYNDLGGGDLKDVIEGISYLESRGYGPFVVGGQSYGAYLASMVLVKYPEVCQGGVLLSGVYTLFPEYASRWLMDSGCVWMDLTDRELLTERSPACHIENLVKPVLVVHGVQDQYAPISGLRHTLQKAQHAGKDELFNTIVYDDEGHGLSKGEHREETYKRMMKFIQEIV